MNILERFKNHLLSDKFKPTKITIKNYLSDIRKFINWFEDKKQSSFNSSDITLIEIKEFEQSQLKKLSASSVKRMMSSMRKFFNFLKTQNEISFDPFATQMDAKTENLDPMHLRDFKNYLFLDKSSHLTIKNYLIDIKQYINWLQETAGEALNSDNLLNLVSEKTIDEYKNRLIYEKAFSSSSINRKLSSLKKYLLWLEENALINFSQPNGANLLSKNELSNNIKNAQNGSPSFFTEKEINEHKEKSYSKFPLFRLFQKVSYGLTFLLEQSFITPIAFLIKRGDYDLWRLRGKKIFTKNSFFENHLDKHKQILSHIPKSIYAPLKISTKNLTFWQKVIYHLKYTRPDWYRKYHQTALVHYFNLAVLFIFCTAIGVSLYTVFISGGKKAPTLASGPSAPLRILSFQGRLTDNNDNPITNPTNVRFIIYNDPSSSGSARLWEEVDQVSPDTNGIFSILLGSNGSGGNASLCNGGNPPTSPATGACGIPQSLFANNPTLYLAVTIENTTELTPRQQIATVPYATNAEVLQGLPPTTDSGVSGNTNVVLALNSSGVLNIQGTSATTFQSTGGQFVLSGKTLTLNTASGTGTNIQLAPDGLGQIDVQKPFSNSTLNGNLKAASNGVYTDAGAVEVDDLFGVLATSSGQSAFTINQDGTGPVISASRSGSPIFTLDGSGNGTFTGNVFGSTGNFTNLNVSNNVTSNLTPSIADTYSLGTSTSNEYLHLFVHDITVNGQSVTQLWQENLGALSPLHITDDLLLGTTATTGARFGFLNVAGGTPTASISAGASGALVVDASGLIQTTASQTLTLGSTTTGNINIGTDSTARNIAIGNTSGATGLTERVGTGNYSLDGVGGSTYAIGASNTTGTITIGGTSQTGTITLGQYNGTSNSTINIGHATVGNGGTQTLGIGDAATGTGKDVITIGNTNGASQTTINAGTGGLSLVGAPVNINTSGSGNTSIGNGTGTVALTLGSDATGDIFYRNSGGTLSRLAIGTGSQCLTGGTTPNWQSCSTGGAGTNYWTLSSPTGGALVPVNSTLDLLIGGTSTPSAKFAFLNVNPGSGTPTASISAGANGAAYLTADGKLQTTASQNILIGGVNSGNITLSPLNTTNGITFTGYATGIIHSTSGVLSSSAVNLNSGDVTNTLGVGNGGTGNASVASGALLYGAGGTSALTPLTIGANHSVLVSNGSVPSWTTSPTFDGDLTVNGNTTLGDATGDHLNITASLNTNLIPVGNGSINLGSSTNYFGTVYANNFISPTTSGTSGFWSLASNTLSPVQTYYDLLVGGTGTSSATWQVFSSQYSAGAVTIPAGTATSSGSLSFRGSATTINSLNGGSLNFQSSVGGDSGLTSNLFIANNGHIGIGNVTNPSNFQLQIAGNVGPNTNNAYDLGSTGNVWANVYATQFKQGASHLNVLDTSNVSGTNNFIAKFTGTNSVGNSSIFDDGSNHVGINNATPQFTLDVDQIGNSTTRNLGKVKVADDFLVQSSSPSALAIFDNTGSGAIITASSSGTTEFTVDGSGNVTANGNVAVNGGSLTTTQTTANLFTNASTLSIAAGSGTTTVNNALTSTGTLTASGTLNVTGTANLNGAINLGDATSDQINVTGQFISSLIPLTDNLYNLGAPTQRWANVYANNIFSSASGGTQGFWQLASNVISPANIWQDVAVGGTATSSAKFQVFGSANGSLYPAGTASTSGYLSFAGSGVAHQINILQNGTLGFYNSVGGDTGVTTSTPSLYLANNGNVGIGTNNPTNTLQIQGASVTTSLISSAGNVNFSLDNNGGNADLINLKDNATTKWIIAKDTDNSFYLLDNAANKHVMKAVTNSYLGLETDGGNVAIGNTNPQGILDITSTLAQPDDLTVNQATTTNLVPNPSFEAALLSTGWTASADMTKSTDRSIYGSNSLKFTHSGAVTETTNSSCIAVTAGGTYTLSGFMYIASGFAGSFNLNLKEFTNGTCSAGGTTDTGFTTATTNAWRRVNSAYALSGGTNSVQVLITTTSGNGTAYADGIQLEQASTPSLYADGSLGPGYYWTGAPNNSSSVRQAGSIFAYQTLNSAAGLGASSRSNFPTLQLDQQGTGDIIAASASGTPELRLLTSGQLQARSFYDLDNTNYFLDPATTGSSASLAGSLTFNPATPNFTHNINYMGLSNLNFQRSVGGDAGLTSTLYLASNGQVGIGTTSTSDQLDVYSSALAFSTTNATAEFFSTDSQAADKGGSIAFGGQDGTITNRTFGAIGGFKLNSTSADYSGYLAFATRNNGNTPAERMRIDNLGNVGIGTTTPVATLQVAGTASASGDLTFYNGSNGVTHNMYLFNNSNLDIQTSVGGAAATTHALYIAAGGKVGFGTTSPGSPVDISSSSDNTLAIETNLSTSFAHAGQFLDSALTSGQNYAINIGQATGTKNLAYFGYNYGGSSGNNNSYLTMGLWGVDNIINITGAGKIGLNEVPDNTNGHEVQISGTVLASGYNGKCVNVAFSTSPLTGCNDDVAEIFSSNESVNPTDLLSISKTTNGTVQKSSTPYDPTALGIVSSQPGVLLGIEGDQVALGGDSTSYSTSSAALTNPAVALNGHVPTTVSTENGRIHRGDYITTSSLSGVGMKATKAGRVIGLALDDFDPSKATTQTLPNGQSIQVEKIFVFVNPTWYDPDVYLTDTGNFNIIPKSDGTYQLLDTSNNNNVITRIGSFGSAIVGMLKAGSIDAQKISTQSFAVSTDNVSIAGQSLHDYIANIVQQTINNSNLGQSNNGNIISPLAQVNHLQTNIISPLADDSNISLDLSHSKLEIRNSSDASNSAVVSSIDNKGNATFSGTLNSENLAVNGDATISGTLHVNQIQANQIAGLQAVVSTLSAQNVTNVTNIIFATPSATPASNSSQNNQDLASTPSGSLLAGNITPSLGYTDISSYSGFLANVPSLHSSFAQFDQGLVSLGPTSLSDTTIAGQLSINANFIIAQNSINVLGADLALQPLRQGGINLENGALAIDTNGNLTVNGKAVFNKTILASVVSPLPNQDLNINLGGEPNSSSSANKNSQFIIRNSSNSAVLSFNQNGDIQASGAATINKLNFNLVQPALAVSDTEVVATGSAGQFQINAYQKEITIDNTSVTANSLIYITPVGNASTQAPYLLRQVPGESFTVGISTYDINATKFNWLIVN